MICNIAERDKNCLLRKQTDQILDNYLKSLFLDESCKPLILMSQVYLYGTVYEHIPHTLITLNPSLHQCWFEK